MTKLPQYPNHLEPAPSIFKRTLEQVASDIQLMQNCDEMSALKAAAEIRRAHFQAVQIVRRAQWGKTE